MSLVWTKSGTQRCYEEHKQVTKSAFFLRSCFVVSRPARKLELQLEEKQAACYNYKHMTERAKKIHKEMERDELQGQMKRHQHCLLN